MDNKDKYNLERPKRWNMAKAGVDPNSFMVAFTSEDLKNINIISLAEITALVKNGYHGAPICEIKEGYGTDTADGSASSYLLPEDATHSVRADSAGYFLQNASAELVLPKYCFAGNQWFYHRDRRCKFIASRDDRELVVFDGEERASATGRKPCEYCCKND